MKLIIETLNQRREINTGFNLYGSAEDLREVKEAIDSRLRDGMALGWVEICSEKITPDTTIYPWESTAVEAPVYPWGVKE